MSASVWANNEEKEIMTPYELSLIIHIHTTPAEFPYSGTEHYAGVVTRMVADGIITKSDNPNCRHGYRLTKEGSFFLSRVLSTPMEEVQATEKESAVDMFTAFTIFDWSDEERPEVRIHGDAATLHIGSHLITEIKGSSPADLKEQLEGYTEIFAAAAKSLGG